MEQEAIAAMVRERHAEQLEPWLWRVANSNLTALRSFAAGIQRDKPAVLAGLTLEWSQDVAERGSRQSHAYSSNICRPEGFAFVASFKMSVVVQSQLHTRS